MEIFLNNKSKLPIYEQITSQIKQLIHKGKLVEGDPLPAMRSFAKSLRVSVITVQKAYEDLQREGYIESVVGRGSFVARPDIEFKKKRYLTEIEVYLDKVVELSKDGNVEMNKVIDLLKKLYEK